MVKGEPFRTKHIRTTETANAEAQRGSPQAKGERQRGFTTEFTEDTENDRCARAASVSFLVVSSSVFSVTSVVNVLPVSDIFSRHEGTERE